MADPVVNLIRTLHELVAADTKGRSDPAHSQVTDLTPTAEALIRRLADNLDIPARLAPSPAAIVGRGSGEAHDVRADIRAVLTEELAKAAGNLESREPLPAPADPKHRERLGTAVGKAYAVSARSRVVPRLLRNGRPDDLGVFAPPILEGDVAAARALALAIGARTRQRDDEVLAALVGAGRGAAAPAAARMVLATKPGYATLPDPEQEAVVWYVARCLEAGFASRDLREAESRELTEEIENRRTDIAGGAGAVDTASRIAAEQVQELHDFLDKLPDWHSANVARAEQVAVAPGAEARFVPGLDPAMSRPGSVAPHVTNSPTAYSATFKDGRSTVRDSR